MLFEHCNIANLTLKNRVCRSATCNWMAGRNGLVNDSIVKLYRELAAGGVGLIFSGHLYVRADGRASNGMTAIDRDECTGGLSRLTAAVHETPGAKLAAQINFGLQSAYDDPPRRQGPSAVAVGTEEVPRALSTDEVKELITAYVDAARRAKAAGFDGVQLHGAHGYMLNRFLSPASNKRDDEFGGSAEGRAEFARRIVTGIGDDLGGEYPLMIKLGTYDGADGGLTVEDTLQIGRWLEEWGVDAIETSGGIGAASTRTRKHNSSDGAYFLDIAARFTEALDIPVISVGGYRMVDDMKAAVESGKSDMISMCRPFIREPDLVNSLASGEKDRADCVSCNGCMRAAEPLSCKLI